MGLTNNTLLIAKETLRIEAESILNGIKQIDHQFVSAVQLLSNCKGRIIVSGIGKSAAIANKIVATLNSTGSPAIFMHAAEAVHGDLGVLLSDDVVICISNSGNSPEIKHVIPFIKARKNPIIGIVGNINSYLAKESDFVINAFVKNEACSFLEAPTSSTTLQLAIGDAIALCLADINGFSNEDFAKSHPGGSLGKKLSLTVGELAGRNQKPAVQIYSPVKELIYEISSKRLGATVVLDGQKIVGIITDGDIRRMLEKELEVGKLLAKDIMGITVKTIDVDSLAQEAFLILKEFNINQLVVVDNQKYFGMVHIHDLVKEGLTE